MSGAHTIASDLDRPHYPFLTRLLLDLLRAGELPCIQSIDIEPIYGHAVRLTYAGGTVRMLRSHNTGINTHSASEISRDKGYTKYFLQHLGYSTPAGKVFLLPSYIDRIDENLSRFNFQEYSQIQDVQHYIDTTIGYPCFVKPNDQSQGKGVHKCYTLAEVQSVIEDYIRQSLQLFLLEQAIDLPDYRVVVFRDRVMACYLRRPLTLIGDGGATIATLLRRKQELFASQGRKPVLKPDSSEISAALRRHHLSQESILMAGQSIPIYDISNLSAGGEAEDVSERIHQHWCDLCIRVTAAMGLDFCGLDLACGTIETGAGPYSILELNATPGLAHYAASGARQAQIVRALYRELFSTWPR